MAATMADTPAPPNDATAAGMARVLEAHRGERHVIVLQDFPDPDAIAAAFAHRLIAARYDITCDAVYAGTVSHQQNRALLRLLEIDLQRYEGTLEPNKYAGSVFVDNQGTTATVLVEALAAAGVPVLVVVDHHAPQNRLHPEFSDVRRAGATATLYAGYLQAGLLALDRSENDHVRLATALMHGLLSDTGGFTRAGPGDFQAAAYLSQFYDGDLLGHIVNQARSRQTMDVIRRALGDRQIADGFCMAGAGFLRAEDRDAIPQAADFLLTEENVHTAVVYGLVGAEGEEKLIGSLRTRKLTLDPDAFLKEALGKNAAGRFFGGGKSDAGGFEIPLEFLAGGHDEALRDLKWQAFDRQLKAKFLDRLGVEPAAPPASANDGS